MVFILVYLSQIHNIELSSIIEVTEVGGDLSRERSYVAVILSGGQSSKHFQQT